MTSSRCKFMWRDSRSAYYRATEISTRHSSISHDRICFCYSHRLSKDATNPERTRWDEGVASIWSRKRGTFHLWRRIRKNGPIGIDLPRKWKMVWYTNVVQRYDACGRVLSHIIGPNTAQHSIYGPINLNYHKNPVFPYYRLHPRPMWNRPGKRRFRVRFCALWWSMGSCSSQWRFYVGWARKLFFLISARLPPQFPLLQTSSVLWRHYALSPRDAL